MTNQITNSKCQTDDPIGFPGLDIGIWNFIRHSNVVIRISSFVLLLALSACSTTATNARPNTDTQRMADKPSVTYPADIDTLANHLLPVAIAQMHWAPLQLTNQVTALRQTALTPADQQVEIRAQSAGRDRSAVQIRVGYFGDEKLERTFQDTLKDVVRRWRKKQ